LYCRQSAADALQPELRNAIHLHINKQKVNNKIQPYTAGASVTGDFINALHVRKICSARDDKNATYIMFNAHRLTAVFAV